jgi:hypothetical protein
MFFLVFWLQKRIGPMWPTLWELGLRSQPVGYQWTLEAVEIRVKIIIYILKSFDTCSFPAETLTFFSTTTMTSSTTKLGETD